MNKMEQKIKTERKSKTPTNKNKKISNFSQILKVFLLYVGKANEHF